MQTASEQRRAKKSEQANGAVLLETEEETTTEVTEPTLEGAPPDVVAAPVDEKDKEKPKERDKPKDPANSETRAAREIREQAHSSIKDWITSLAGDGEVRVQVVRTEPKHTVDPRTGERKKCDGQVARYDRVIEPEEIQEKHGGGTYQLKVTTPDGKGVWRYLTAKTVEIAGDPRLDDVPRTPTVVGQPAPIVAPSSDPMVSKMFDQMIGVMSKPSGPQGPTADTMMAMMQNMMAPFRSQIDSLTALLKAKDEEMASIRLNAGKDPFRDTLMTKLMDQDTARLTALKMQHDSEISKLKEGFSQDEKRIKDAHDRDIERIERTHEREIKSVRDSLEREIATLKLMGEHSRQSSETLSTVQRSVLDAEIRRLEAALNTSTAELTALRARKDQTTAEKIHELNALKDLVSDGDDKGESSTLEKVIGAVGQLPVVAKLAERMGGNDGGGDGQQQARVRQVTQAQALASQRPRLVRDKRTGAVAMVDPRTGQATEVRRKPPTAEGTPSETAPSYDPAQVKEAVAYMEAAFRSGQEAKIFAESVRALIPNSILANIRSLGIDDFLSKVAMLDGTSPLTTQSGRNWIRRVAKVLMGADEEE